MLVLFFRFRRSRVPFIHHVRHNTCGLALHSLCCGDLSRRRVLFRRARTKFIHAANNAVHGGLHHDVQCLRCTPVRAVDGFYGGFCHSLSRVRRWCGVCGGWTCSIAGFGQFSCLYVCRAVLCGGGVVCCGAVHGYTNTVQKCLRSYT